jgi:hypothetical protein
VADHPSPGALWNQALSEDCGEGTVVMRYRELLREHGLLLAPGDPGYDDAPHTLPCGWPGPQEPVSEWCVHDLPPGACGDCAPRQNGAPAREDASYGPWISARYPGRCSSCDERIRDGDQIRSDGEGGWLCSDCGEVPGA